MAAELARKEKGKIVTSNLVLGETWTLLRRRSGHFAAVGFLDKVGRLPNFEAIYIDKAMTQQAWKWLRRYGDREYSFVDATSFILMKSRRIREALAFDGDFSSAGFIEVRP